MKYLDLSLYEKLCCMNPDKEDEERWEKAYQEYTKQFNLISSRLPKNFLKEFRKYEFHDNIVDFITISKNKLKTRYRYDMYMELTDYHEENVVHQLIFSDIKILKTNMIFGGCAGSFDWLYCEFLAIDKKRLSLEVILFGDSFLYVDFSKLHYKKHLKSKIDRTGN